MDDLPFELFTEIAQYLDNKSLLNLALVDRAASTRTRPLRLHTVHIWKKWSYYEVVNPTLTRYVGSFTDQTKELQALLSAADGFRHVRHVKVLANSYEHPGMNSLAASPRNIDSQYLELWRHSIPGRKEPKAFAADQRGLVRLLKRLPTLKELTWACRESPSAATLRYVHSFLPHCRLHIHGDLTIWRDLYRGWKKTERQVPASPCLETLTYTYAANAYQDETITEAALEKAPNLKALRILWRDTTNPFHPLSQEANWHPGAVVPTPGKTQSAIETLELSCANTGAALYQCARITKFECLRTLKLHVPISPQTVEWFARHCRFNQLEELVIAHTVISPLDAEEHQSAILVEGILACPALRSLELSNRFRPDSLDSLFSHCGDRLTRLDLKWPPITLDLFTSLLNHCPSLEEIGLHTYRRGNQYPEHALYHALGTLPRLRLLRLSIRSVALDEVGLDTSNPSSVCALLHDLAIDATLAASIFCCVSTAKRPGAVPFQQLELCNNIPINFRRYVPYQEPGLYKELWGSVLSYLSCFFTCRRTLSSNPARGFECSIEEHDQRGWNHRAKMDDEIYAVVLGADRLGGILRCAWQTGPGQTLKDVVRSLPLKCDLCTREPGSEAMTFTQKSQSTSPLMLRC